MHTKYNAVKHFFILEDELVPQPFYQSQNYVYSDEVLEFFAFIHELNNGGVA